MRINICLGSRTILYLCSCKFLYFLLSIFLLCSSLTWCSLSFSWMNSLPHSSHFTIGWRWMCLAWLIRSSYFVNFSPHWSQTSFSLLWRMPKLFLYNRKFMTIKKILLYSAPPAHKVLNVVQTFVWVCSADGKSGQMNWLRGGGLQVYAYRACGMYQVMERFAAFSIATGSLFIEHSGGQKTKLIG